MARLIALHNAGAHDELNQLLSDLKETRSRNRRVTMAYNNPAGYITTTAEADSASANPDLDEEEFLFQQSVS